MTVSAAIREQPPDYQTALTIPRPPGAGTPAQPNQPPPQPRTPDDEEETGNENGNAAVQVRELTPDLARQLDLPTGVQGVVVISSDTAEVQRGDVIEEVDQQPVRSVEEFNKAMSALENDRPHVLSVCRHRVRSFVVLRPH